MLIQKSPHCHWISKHNLSELVQKNLMHVINFFVPVVFVNDLISFLSHGQITSICTVYDNENQSDFVISIFIWI